MHRVTKLFKVACLGYRASEVEYRGLKIGRDRFIRLRKFLVG